MKLMQTTALVTLALSLGLASCGKEQAAAAPEATAPEAAPAAQADPAPKAASTDYSVVTPTSENPGELPIWLIPNMPESAEAYYGPDS